MQSFFQRGTDIVDSTNKRLESVQLSLPDTQQEIDSQEMLWGRIRARLQGELLGAMPPPGAPPGALSPIQPRRHHGIPLYSMALTTEVLSINTRKATFDDTRHANDEGGPSILLPLHSLRFSFQTRLPLHQKWILWDKETVDCFFFLT